MNLKNIKGGDNLKKKTKFLLGTVVLATAASLTLAAKTNKDFNGIVIKSANIR